MFGKDCGMGSEKEKKVLKIVGIVIIIAAIISAGYGISVVHRGKRAALLMSSDPDYQKSLSALISSGIGMVVSALFNLAEGVSSFLASKNSRFAGPAWVCSLLSLLSNGISGVSSIIRTGFSVGALSGLILSIGLALQVYVAAGKLKANYKSAMS